MMRSPSSKRSKMRAICKKLIKENPDFQYTKTFKRHLNDLENLPQDRYRFNETLANLYIQILQTLKHSKGEKAGTPLLLEDWQKAAVGIAMGWEYKNNKGVWVRRFNTLLFYMARKQGKSLLTAGLSLVDSLIRPQAGSEIAMIATKADQAKLVWDEVYQMVQTHKDLKDKYHKVGNTLHSKIDNGKIYPLGRDSKSLDGLNISCICCDEYHAHPSTDLLDVCRSSQGAREEPLTIIISTAGFSLSSPLIPELEYARKILDGQLQDEHYFAFLAEPNPNDDRYLIETLKKSNPNMNVSVSEEFLLKQLEDAKNRPELRANYLTKHLNIFVSASEEFISIKDWQYCELNHPIPENIKTILIGCDLSVSDDLTAIITAAIDYEDNLYVIDSSFYLPSDRIEELALKFKAPLQDWVTNGYLKTTKGKTIDYDVIYEHLKETIEKYQHLDVEIYYDAFKFKSIKNTLENKLGFKGAFPVNQGFLTLNEPLALMATYVRNQKLRHINNPVLNWNMSNLKIQYDSYGNMKPDKSSHYEKIDGAAALCNIFYGLLKHTKEEEAQDEIIFI